MTSKRFHRAFATVALTSGLVAAPAVANADQVDQVLAALPAGPISCEQATKYWTNEADYNDKVAKANLLAMVDSRGPQIRDALARVDEAANRCGLKGGGGAAPAPAPAPAGGGQADAGAAPAPAPEAPAGPAPIVSSAPGLPTVTFALPSGQSIVLPNVQQIIKDFLAQYGIRI
ncbi:hypothetical protein QVA66_10920 [Staphylococcus chromogenes]|nr:hypothetical protein [Staphylococcus chromogenes]